MLLALWDCVLVWGGFDRFGVAIMDWINIHTSTLDSADFIRCHPDQRAAWLMLLRYCAGQENGGRIVGAKAWGDTTWQQMCRVRKKEVQSDCGLFDWDGDDLIVRYYPDHGEQRANNSRENGKKGGRPKNPDKTQWVSSGIPSG